MIQTCVDCYSESFPTYYECRACGNRFNKPSNFVEGEHSSAPATCWTVNKPAPPPPPMLLASWIGVHLDKDTVANYLVGNGPILVRHHVFDTDSARHNLVFSYASHEGTRRILDQDWSHMARDAYGNMHAINIRVYTR